MSDSSKWPRAKSGIDWELEERATEILMSDRRDRNVTKHSEKKEWFSPGQMYRRRSREITNQNGVPEKGIMSGMFKRVYRPDTRPKNDSGM